LIGGRLVTADETELEMTERHVREGERHIASRMEILAHLRMHGQDTDLAERLLANLEDLLAMHRAHRARLQPQHS
jgi:hypothetical protein